VATYQISELAEQSGVPATTLRYYEQAGLLTPTRSPNGYRRYTDDALDRLTLIRAGQHLDLPLAQIRALLTVRDGGVCADVRARLRPLLAARIVTARERAAGLADSITRLEQALTATDPVPQPGPCSLDCGCLTTSPPPHQPPGPNAQPPQPQPPHQPPQPHSPGQALQHQSPHQPPQSQSPSQALQHQSRQQPPQPQASRQQHTPQQAQVPIACSLDGDGQQARLAEWRGLFAQATAREPVTDGVRFTLPTARAGRAAELAAAEQRCCPFFRFALVFDGGDVHLTVQAPADAGELLAALTDELDPAVSC
jgi:MerR family transcriptional regulator, copper efflux regulator